MILQARATLVPVADRPNESFELRYSVDLWNADDDLSRGDDGAVAPATTDFVVALQASDFKPEEQDSDDDWSPTEPAPPQVQKLPTPAGRRHPVDGTFKISARRDLRESGTTLYLRFFHDENAVGRLALDVTGNAAGSGEAVSTTGFIYIQADMPRRPDLTLFASRRANDTIEVAASRPGARSPYALKVLGHLPTEIDRISFVLSDPPGPTNGNDDAANKRLFVRIDVALEPHNLRRARFEQWGRELWCRLPRWFHDFYWQEMHQTEIGSVAICGDQAYVPWELILPGPPKAAHCEECPPGVSPRGEPLNLLGLRFAVTRWIDDALPSSVRVAAIDAVAAFEGRVPSRIAAETPDEVTHCDPTIAGAEPGDTDESDLEVTQLPDDQKEEVRYLQQAYGATLEEHATGVLLERMLGEPEARIIHLCAHGTPSEMYLEDGPLAWVDLLEPEPADPQPSPALAGDAKALIMNSCAVGRPDETYCGQVIGSWADALIGRGCAAVVGPYWMVASTPANIAAEVFYSALTGRTPRGREPTLGEAARAIRTLGTVLQCHPKLSDPQALLYHPTMLAYTAFGHPNAHLSFPPPVTTTRRPDCRSTSPRRWRPGFHKDLER